MRPGESGWLRRYIQFRVKSITEAGGREGPTQWSAYPDREHFLYHTLQPTGLIYGFPVGFPDFPEARARSWGMQTRARVLLAESHLNAGLFPDAGPSHALEAHMREVFAQVKNFYVGIFPRYNQQGASVLGRQRTVLDQVEHIFGRRVLIRNDWRNFWSSFFHNSLVFADLLLFARWLESSNPAQLPELREKRKLLRLALLDLIAAAAASGHKAYPEAREMYFHFLESAELPAGLRKKYSTRLEHPVEVGSIDLSAADTWLARKYLLEITALATLAPNFQEDKNQQFLEQAAETLQLGSIDLAQSLRHTESFVAAYREQLFFFQPRQRYLKATDVLVAQMRREIRKNHRGLQRELKQSRILAALLAKSTRQELTAEEWETVRNHLLEALKTIPAFTVFLLPGGSITLPLLMRLFPRSWLFPNLYDEDDD